MRNNIIDILKNSQHCVIQTHDGNAHVYPAIVFENIIAGRNTIKSLDENVVVRIIEEWYNEVVKS